MEQEGGSGEGADLLGILMPRRNIAWKVCMSWQSGQQKWCRAEHSAWPWGRAGISGRGVLLAAPELGDGVTTGAGGNAATWMQWRRNQVLA